MRSDAKTPRPAPRRRRPLVLSVVGARPQFVKAGPLSRALRRRMREVLVHTGQHYDPEMSRSFFDELGLPEPDHHLGIGSGSHGAMTGRMLVGLEEVMQRVRPDLVLVPGDTNSTLAGALAAVKLGIPVAHVEAGLRSFDPRMPEEINRRLTDAVSTLLFCPTRAAVANLRSEGVRRGVHRVGDVMLDAIRQHLGAARVRPLPEGLEPGSYYLATLHRQENTDDPARLRALVTTLAGLARPVVLPLHPRTRVRLRQLRLRPGGAIRLMAPVSYLDSLRLLLDARAVLTDSGGMQKEAFILGTPCVTLRRQTEWVETIEAGANRLAGADPRRIRACLRQVERAPRRAPGAARLYGGGRAAERIAARIERFLSG
jgi:UDP-N-acetylglucosamine 2-epimerase